VSADLSIPALALDRATHDPGDGISGTAALSRELADGEELAAELWDNLGRKRQQGDVTVTGTGVGFTFQPFEPLTILHQVRLAISRQGAPLASRTLAFPVRATRATDEMQDIAWAGAQNQFITTSMLRKLASEDETSAVDVGWSGATSARNLAAANLSAVPYTARYGPLGAGPDHVVPVLADNAYGCMSSPVTLGNLDKWGETQSAIFGPYGPLAWTHGDETHYSADPDVCWSETCLAAFREYLREVYSDLAALNKEWHTTYADWSQVMPITFEQAKQTGNYAPWLEHRLSADRVFARFYGRSGEALSKHDPKARAGFDGPQALSLPNGGINWWVLKDHVGILQDYQYNSESMEILRSFAGPQHLAGMWYGTYGLTWQLGPNTVPFHHHFPWYSLFHGLSSTWMWTMGAPGPLSGYAPDLTNLPFFEASRQSLRQINSGIFALLRNARRANDGIAIHYSEASRIADSLFSDDKRCTAWMESLADFNHAVEDCGLQYQYLAYEQIEQDELRKGAYRVLLMPHSRAVSDREAAAIRRFVDDGGLLIADIMPGVLNGHGSRQEPSALADLFPLSEPGSVNSVGKGKTVLLGDALSGYGYAAFRNMQGWKRLQGRSRVLADLLRTHAGIVPQATVSPRGEDEMPPTEITRFEVADAQFIGLLRKHYYYDNAPYPATVHFPARRHTYDVRAGRYLGYIDSLDTDISYEAQLYACLPYVVRSLTVNADSADRAAPTEVRVSLQTDGPAPVAGHMVDLRVLAPDGRELPWCTRRVPAVAGNAVAVIPWALNDPPGRYTLTARDVATGVSARQEVVLP